MSTLKHILPQAVFRALEENLNAEKLREIRLRAGKPVSVLYDGKAPRYLTANGVGDDRSKALVCSADDVNRAVVFSAEHSVYAYSDDINRGFISLPNGCRVGICGEVVSDDRRVLSVKGYSSVNIRIPHEIIGCSQCIMTDIVSNSCRVLLISAPGAGKTTMLRDIARALSDGNPPLNVLIADERNEISCTVGGICRHDVGTHTDVIVGGSKEHMFECAVRSMRPDVIVTDEIFGMKDVEILREAVGCGISVVASAHASDPTAFSKRAFFRTLVGERLFERYIFLSDSFVGNRVSAIYDAEYRPL